MAELSREEFYEKYGHIWVNFSHYYKYTFYFTGKTPEGYTIEVGYGGCAEEIYRYNLSSNETESVISGNFYMGSVTDPKTFEEIDSFYDY